MSLDTPSAARSRRNARELAGRTAVVTGASTGIGRAIALELAAAGADVLVHCRSNRTEANAVARTIRSLRCQSQVVACDLAKQSGRDELLEAAWNWRGGVHIWVNNAGADVLTGDAASWSFEQKLEHLWQVDVQATMALSRGIAQPMIAANIEQASIINIGWDQAEQGMAGDSGQMFGAIKGAVMAFTRSLAQTIAPHVRANCVAPGWIRTEWGQTASDYWQARATCESLMQRWGMPEDVARAVRFLASPASEFIAGHTLPVNGGFRHGRA